MTLYHSQHTRSIRVLWLLEEMQLPYNLETLSLELGNTGGKKYAKINPLQKVPALEIDGKLLLESTAILAYLTSVMSGGDFALDANDPNYGLYLQWLHGGESAFGMYLSLYFGHSVLLPENQRSKLMADWSLLNLKNNFDQLGSDLGSNEFITGEKFTTADISVGYIAYGMSLLGKLDEIAPQNVINWWQRLAERPALKKALSF